MSLSEQIVAHLASSPGLTDNAVDEVIIKKHSIKDFNKFSLMFIICHNSFYTFTISIAHVYVYFVKY